MSMAIAVRTVLALQAAVLLSQATPGQRTEGCVQTQALVRQATQAKRCCGIRMTSTSYMQQEC